MKVCEIFTSIQGESTFAGSLCTFIRLSGCNLRCSYCDTVYAYEEGHEMSIAAIVSAVNIAGIRLVEITGGEPLLQSETRDLVSALSDEGFLVLIETNGSVSIRDIDRRAVIIMDIKTPGSGMHEKMDYSNLKLLNTRDEIKFVITDRIDYEWALGTIGEYGLGEICTILLSPVAEKLDPSLLAQWMINDKINARLNMQIHKCIFGSDRRGV